MTQGTASAGTAGVGQPLGRTHEVLQERTQEVGVGHHHEPALRDHHHARIWKHARFCSPLGMCITHSNGVGSPVGRAHGDGNLFCHHLGLGVCNLGGEGACFQKERPAAEQTHDGTIPGLSVTRVCFLGDTTQ
eukprot:1148305-Pelagomonas_calceolata.AAC.3